MINIGKFNKLKIVRKADFGYYLDAETKNTNDDVLLPNGNTLDRELEIGDEVEAFIYRDSKDRLVATLKTPMAEVGDIAYLEVVQISEIGAFVDFGLERDVFVPYREQKHKLHKGAKYLFLLYLDKTGRMAATPRVEQYIEPGEGFNIGDEVTAIVYDIHKNGNLVVAIDGKYRGIVLKNEYFSYIPIGEQLKFRVKKVFEDGTVSLTPRGKKLEERNDLQETILEYIKAHDGFMEFNDKSNPDDIRKCFNTSKNYFKMALGGLMKKNLIKQSENGTELVNK